MNGAKRSERRIFMFEKLEAVEKSSETKIQSCYNGVCHRAGQNPADVCAWE